MIKSHYRRLTASQFASLAGGAASISAVDVRVIGSDHVLHVYGEPRDGLPGTNLGDPSTWHRATYRAVFEARWQIAEDGEVTDSGTCAIAAVPDGATILESDLAPNTFS